MKAGDLLLLLLTSLLSAQSDIERRSGLAQSVDTLLKWLTEASQPESQLSTRMICLDCLTKLLKSRKSWLLFGQRLFAFAKVPRNCPLFFPFGDLYGAIADVPFAPNAR